MTTGPRARRACATPAPYSRPLRSAPAPRPRRSANAPHPRNTAPPLPCACDYSQAVSGGPTMIARMRSMLASSVRTSTLEPQCTARLVMLASSADTFMCRFMLVPDEAAAAAAAAAKAAL